MYSRTHTNSVHVFRKLLGVFVAAIAACLSISSKLNSKASTLSGNPPDLHAVHLGDSSTVVSAAPPWDQEPLAHLMHRRDTVHPPKLTHARLIIPLKPGGHTSGWEIM